jgi:hypothetical protein
VKEIARPSWRASFEEFRMRFAADRARGVG